MILITLKPLIENGVVCFFRYICNVYYTVMQKTNETLLSSFELLQKEYDALKAKYELEHRGHKQAEEALSDVEQRTKNIIKDTSAGYFFIDRDGHFQAVNDAWLKMHKYESEKEIVGQHFSITQVDHDLSSAKATVAELLNGKTTITGDFSRKCKDGSVGYHTFSAHPVQKDGKVIGMEGFLIDISNKKQIEHALQQSEAKFRSIFDQSPVGSVIVGLDKKFIRCNAAFCNFLDYTEQELIGKNISEVTHPEDTEVGSQEMKRIAAGDIENARIQKRYCKKDGSIVWGEVSISIVRDEENRPLFFLPIIQDITEQYRSKEILEENENNFHAIFDSHSAAIAIIEKDTTISMVNDAYCKLSGYSKEEVIGLSWTKQIPPNDLERLKEYNRRRIADPNDAPSEYEFSFYKKNGDISYAMMSVGMIQHSGRIIASFIDITERKQAEESLKTSEYEFHLLAEAMPQIVWITKPDGWNIYFNQQWVDYTGLSLEDSYGHGWNTPFHPDDQHRAWVAWQNATQNNASYSLECRLRRLDGVYKWWLIRGVPIRNENGIILKWFGTCTDIDELKNAEEALRISEDRFRSIFENMASACCFDKVIYKDGKAVDYIVVDVNPAYEKILGISKKDVVNKLASEIYNTKDIPFFDIYAKVAETGEPQTFESYFAPAGIFLNVTASRPAPGMFSTVFTDITERKLAETLLRAEKDRIRTIMDMVGDPIFMKDNDHRITLANRAFYEMFNLDEQSVLGFTLAENVPEHERKRFLEVDRGVLDTGKADIREEELTLDGRTRTIITRKIRFIDESGNKFLVGSIHDITARKKTEVTIRENNSRLELAMQAANMAWWAMDISTGNVTFERRKAEMLGFPPDKFSHYQDFTNFVHPEDRENAMNAMRDHLSGKAEKYEIEYRILTKAGDYKWFYDIGAVVKRDSAGAPLSVTGIVIDISERKKAEAVIKELNETLEDKVVERTALLEVANKELEAFSYSVSHDLRGPLRRIDGFSQILLDDYTEKLDEGGLSIVNTVRTNVQRLGKLIDDLLDFSRYSRHEMQLAEVNMKMLCSDAYKELTDADARKRILLQLENLPNIQGDATLLKQVWVNLLSNAIKYSSKKEKIEITISSETMPDKVTFCIKDKGAGFEMKYAKKLFGVFERLHGEEEFSGTGVGLAVVKRIIDRHHGEIWAESEVGQGATFYFSLPK